MVTLGLHTHTYTVGCPHSQEYVHILHTHTKHGCPGRQALQANATQPSLLCSISVPLVHIVNKNKTNKQTPDKWFKDTVLLASALIQLE